MKLNDYFKVYNVGIILMLLCFLPWNGHGQTAEFQEEVFDSLYTIHKKKFLYQDHNQAIKNSHKLINYLEKLDSLDKDLRYKKGNLYRYIMLKHINSKNNDSADFYFDYIKNNFSEYNYLMINSYISKGIHESLFKKNYEKSLEYYYQAYDLAKRFNFKKKRVAVLFNLVTLYKETKENKLVHELLNEIKLLLEGSKDDKLKLMLDLEEANLLIRKGKSKEALARLKTLENLEPSLLSSFNSHYDFTLFMCYLKLKDFDKAKYHLDIASDSDKKPTEVPIADHIYYAKLYTEKGEFTTALNELNKIEDTSLSKNVSEAVLEYYELHYKVQDTLGNKGEALSSLKTYVKLKSEKDEELSEKKAAILKYQLKKDSEINRIAREQEQQKIASDLKQVQTNYKYLAVILSLFLIGIILYHLLKRKQAKEKLNLKLKSKMLKVKNQYIENLTHEFKTPLSVNLGYLNLIKTNALIPNKVNDYVEMSKSINRKLISNIESLLFYVKQDQYEGLLQDKKSEKQVYSFITDLIRHHRFTCATKELEIVFRTNVSKDMVLSFDFFKLEKVLNNLIDNAIKFSKTGGQIQVSFLLTEKAVQISVKDKGIGIPKEDQGKIFERFYQSKSNTNKDNEGFGIGMYLVKSIINSWNGNIDLKSEEGKGTKFFITIPVEHPEFDLDELEERTEVFFTNVNDSKEEDQSPVKILIVENQLDMVNYLSHILGKHYYCDFAYNGKIAYDLIKQNSYDLIICDYKMPVMDGLELRTLLSKDKKYADLPFILISASSIPDSKIEAYNKDENFIFLQKPFKEADLKQIMKSMIGKTVNQNMIIGNDAEELESKKNNDIQNFLQKTRKYIYDNIDNADLRIENIANYMGYSKSNFARTIKDYTNLNPINIIQEIRLLKAYEIINKGHHATISEVIAKVGFNSRAHFYKLFENRFKVKPGKMFKQCRDR